MSVLLLVQAKVVPPPVLAVKFPGLTVLPGHTDISDFPVITGVGLTVILKDTGLLAQRLAVAVTVTVPTILKLVRLEGAA